MESFESIKIGINNIDLLVIRFVKFTVDSLFTDLKLELNISWPISRFHKSLWEIFSKSVSLRVMKKLDKSALMQISQVFGRPFNMLPVKWYSETALSREWSNQDFRSVISEIH